MLATLKNLFRDQRIFHTGRALQTKMMSNWVTKMCTQAIKRETHRTVLLSRLNTAKGLATEGYIKAASHLPIPRNIRKHRTTDPLQMTQSNDDGPPRNEIPSPAANPPRNIYNPIPPSRLSPARIAKEKNPRAH